MFALFLLVVTIATYCVGFMVLDISRYIGMMIGFTRTDSTIKKVSSINRVPSYILTLCIPFIVWYCWTH